MRGHLLEMMAGAEGLALGGQDDDRHIAIGRDRLEMRLERGQHRVREGVARSGMVEGQDRDAPVIPAPGRLLRLGPALMALRLRRHRDKLLALIWPTCDAAQGRPRGGRRFRKDRCILHDDVARRDARFSRRAFPAASTGRPATRSRSSAAAARIAHPSMKGRSAGRHNLRPGDVALADVALYVAISPVGPVASRSPPISTSIFCASPARRPHRRGAVAEARQTAGGRRGDDLFDGERDIVAHATGTYSIPPRGETMWYYDTVYEKAAWFFEAGVAKARNDNLALTRSPSPL